MNAEEKEFLAYLSDFITPHKIQLMEEILALRTRHFTVVLENIYKPHNASAVLRTADCFGLQDIHVIEKENSYKINPYVTRGASQWVDIYKYDNKEGKAVSSCFSNLKSKGYKVMATSPNSGSIPIQELDANHKIALVFGNEHEGVSQEVVDGADGLVHIPMYGFTESFNISVAASIFLFELRKKVMHSIVPDFFLNEEEKDALRSKWYRALVKQVRIHEKEFNRKRSQN